MLQFQNLFVRISFTISSQQILYIQIAQKETKLQNSLFLSKEQISHFSQGRFDSAQVLLQFLKNNSFKMTFSSLSNEINLQSTNQKQGCLLIVNLEGKKKIQFKFMGKHIKQELKAFERSEKQEAKYKQNCENMNDFSSLLEVEVVGNKILSTNDIPNFILLSKTDKGRINEKRFSLMFFLCPFNREKGKQDFINLLNYSLNEEQKQGDFPTFIKEYVPLFNSKTCFKWYTKQSFFYRILNKGLRTLEKVNQLAYLRLPFSDLYTSIKNEYFAQFNENFKSKQSFKCYRAGKLSQFEYQTLQSSIGNFIQMQGFLSTSLSINYALGFCLNFNCNVLFEIEVLSSSLDFNHGFANISKFSQIMEEGEILFNALNFFQVKSVRKDSKKCFHPNGLIQKIEIIVVALEYGGFSKLSEKKKNGLEISPSQQQILNYLSYEKYLVERMNQGIILVELGKYYEAIKWFNRKNGFKKKKKELYEEENNPHPSFQTFHCIYLKIIEEIQSQLKKESNSFSFALSICMNGIKKLIQGKFKESLKEFQISKQIAQKNQSQCEKIIPIIQEGKKIILGQFNSLQQMKKKIEMKESWYAENHQFFHQNLLVSAVISEKQNKWKKVIQKTQKSLKCLDYQSETFKKHVILQLEAYIEENQKEQFESLCQKFMQYKIQTINQRKDLIVLQSFLQICLKGGKWQKILSYMEKILQVPIQYEIEEEDLKSFIFVRNNLRQHNPFYGHRFQDLIFLFIQNSKRSQKLTRIAQKRLKINLKRNLKQKSLENYFIKQIEMMIKFWENGFRKLQFLAEFLLEQNMNEQMKDELAQNLRKVIQNYLQKNPQLNKKTKEKFIEFIKKLDSMNSIQLVIDLKKSQDQTQQSSISSLNPIPQQIKIKKMFTQWLIYHDESIQIDPQTNSLISREEVHLQKGGWAWRKMPEICKNIKEWKVHSLWLQFNERCTILLQIENIFFTSLRRIFLLENNIYSIETLGRVRMPKLQGVSFSHNFLTNAASLRKANFPSLQSVSFQENLISEFKECLPATKFYKFKRIDYEFDERMKEQCPDLRFMVKIQSKEINIILKRSAKRLKQPYTTNIFVKRFPEIESKFL